MSRIILLVVVLIAGLIAGPLLAGSAGYVMIRVAGYSIEMTLITLCLLVLIVVLCGWGLTLAGRQLLRLPAWAGGARGRRRQRRLRALEDEGLLRLLAGDARGAWPLLARVAHHTPNLATRLLAIDSAERCGEQEEADQLRQELPDDAPLLALVAARSALDRGDLVKAQQLLAAQPVSGSDGSWLLLRRELAERQQDWATVEQCIQPLRKLGYLDDSAAQRQASQLHIGQIETLARHEGAAAALGYYRKLPRNLRKSPALMVAAAAPLLARGEAGGEQLIGDALRAEPDDGLLQQMALLPGLPADGLILDAKKLLKKLGDSPARLEFLAELCQRAGRGGEAEGYRQQARQLRLR